MRYSSTYWSPTRSECRRVPSTTKPTSSRDVSLLFADVGTSTAMAPCRRVHEIDRAYAGHAPGARTMTASDQPPANREPFGIRLARIEERLGGIQEHAATKAEIRGLEAEIRSLEARIESVREHGATKADIRALEARIGWWLLGVSVLVVAGLVVQIVG